MKLCLLLCSCILRLTSSHLLSQTITPPLLTSPTYSLATQGTDGTTGMNILTYASPASITPDGNRVWTLGLYKGTIAYENFQRTGTGVLQLLTPRHAKLVRLLGGSSGRDVDKRLECERLGFPWMRMSMSPSEHNEANNNANRGPEVLPECCCYLRLTLVGDLVECGSHDVAVCKVEEMLVPDGETYDGVHLDTAMLRDMGIITAQGRVAD
mmetsp:Transcript_56616/g.66167  ORF Transcript_56616/g.66167 Transcript_56616/m.66167 type:complete len:211 (-) Transcript_56616:445-1077(-)